jgi:hypothetical protein
MMSRVMVGNVQCEQNGRYSIEVINFIKLIMSINLMGHRIIVSEVKKDRRNDL